MNPRIDTIPENKLPMDASERERLRQRLNFPSVTVDDEPEAPLTPVDAAPEPAAEPAPEPAAEVDPTAGLVAALERMAQVVERIDGRLEDTRSDIHRLHERLDRLEFALPVDISVDDLAGIEAVRRTVAASHRALTAQLGRMFEGLEGRLRHGDRVAVSVGSSDQL